MQEFDLAKFLLAAATLRNMAGHMRDRRSCIVMPVSTLERFRRDAETMKHEASRFGFGASLACADRIADLLEKGAEPEDQAFHGEPIIKIQIFHMDAIVREVEHLESRLLDELTNFKVVAVPARKSELLSGKEKFWAPGLSTVPIPHI